VIFADGFAGLLLLGLWLFCLIDAITTPDGTQRNLPKIAWVLIVLLLADIGSVLWLVAGRPWKTSSGPRTKVGRAFPEYDRPGRHVAANPDDDEQFLRQIRERAQTQRAQYEARRKAERDAEQQRLLRRPAQEPDEQP
jgi:Phospholipase_D-nuclease N-terminal